MLLVGCCGWCLGRQKYYASFNVVELQNTFYDMPDEGRLRSLRGEAPEGFRFTMKAWQAVTHPPGGPTWRRARHRLPEELADRYGNLRTTKENLEAWDVVARAARALGASVVVVQTPPGFGASEDNARQAAEFFRAVATRDFTIGWEPRGTWRSRPDLIAKVIGDLDGIIHVVDPFRASPAVERPVVYFRLHGIGGREVNYRYRYTDNDLEVLCNKVRGLREARDVYVMFNNVFMKGDASRFRSSCASGL
jgi:uncharacterized protein YecE (DUF72 family)